MWRGASGGTGAGLPSADTLIAVCRSGDRAIRRHGETSILCANPGTCRGVEGGERVGGGLDAAADGDVVRPKLVLAPVLFFRDCRGRGHQEPQLLVA